LFCTVTGIVNVIQIGIVNLAVIKDTARTGVDDFFRRFWLNDFITLPCAVFTDRVYVGFAAVKILAGAHLVGSLAAVASELCLRVIHLAVIKDTAWTIVGAWVGVCRCEDCEQKYA